MRAFGAAAATATAVVCVLLAVASCNPIVFKDCGSTSGVISVVDVQGCTDLPCPLVKGTNASVAVTFTSKTTSKTATSAVCGVIAGVCVPFPLPNPNGCVNSGLSCPLKASSSYTFTTSLPISTSYPDLQLVVKWKLQDDQSNNLFCFLFPVKIVSQKRSDAHRPSQRRKPLSRNGKRRH